MRASERSVTRIGCMAGILERFTDLATHSVSGAVGAPGIEPRPADQAGGLYRRPLGRDLRRLARPQRPFRIRPPPAAAARAARPDRRRKYRPESRTAVEP